MTRESLVAATIAETDAGHIIKDKNAKVFSFKEYILSTLCLLQKHTPGGGPSAGLSTSGRCVRFIVRDAGGKYCWDASVLHGPPGVAESTTPGNMDVKKSFQLVILILSFPTRKDFTCSISFEIVVTYDQHLLCCSL